MIIQEREYSSITRRVPTKLVKAEKNSWHVGAGPRVGFRRKGGYNAK